jgi:hypothetical protein
VGIIIQTIPGGRAFENRRGAGGATAGAVK